MLSTYRNFYFRGLLFSALGLVPFLVFPSLSKAQLVPDNTLGTENSIVTPQNLRTLIEGGAIRGDRLDALFHSFTEFNVNLGEQVYFANPDGIVNIFTRVTGFNPSNINGVLGVDGGANLFLLNPNGISFGAFSSLDVSGSFFATTADSFVFGNGLEFGVDEPEEAPLLTIKITPGLQYGEYPGDIVNQSTAPNPDGSFGLQVTSGQTLGLIGSEVQFLGGFVFAPDARVEIGSVGVNGLVSLTETNAGFALGYEGIETFQDISLSESAIVSNSGIITSGEGGGSIQLQGRNIRISDASLILADTLGSQSGGGIVINSEQLVIEDGSEVRANVFRAGDGGNLTVNATDSVQVVGTSADGSSSSLLARARRGSTGNAGDLIINTSQLLILGGANVDTITFGAGNGGSLTVNATDSVQVIGTSADGQFPSALSARPFFTGDAGDLTINTSQLLIQDGAFVSISNRGAGNAGNLTINASDFVHVIGLSENGRFASGVFTQATSNSTGNAGNLTITTSNFLVQDGAQISAGTFGAGNGGNLTINATDFVQVIGRSENGQVPSGLFSTAENPGFAGSAGDLTITTSNFLVQDGAQISASTFGQGNGGNIKLNVDDTILIEGTDSGIFSTAETGSTGNPGSITIDPEQVTIRDGGFISVQSRGTGTGGNLTIISDNLTLDNGSVTTQTVSTDGGNITLNIADLLLLRNGDGNALISATAGGIGNGGNLNIDTTFLVAFPNENSDIAANAFLGDGGRVNITADGIFGIQFRDTRTPDNDITVTSTAGSDGIVQLNTPDTNPAAGLNNLPSAPANPQPIQGCQTITDEGDATFVDKGRGGLPPNPYEALSNSDIWEDVDIPTQLTENPRQIIEAQGWIINEKGNVELVADVAVARARMGCGAS